MGMKIKKRISLIIVLFILGLVFSVPAMPKLYVFYRIFHTRRDDRYSSIIDLKDSFLARFISDDIYVDYLLERAIPYFQGPEGNEFVLGKFNLSDWFSGRERKVLEKKREEIVAILVRRLKNFDNSAALVLGYLRVEDALPLLRNAFINDDYFYGWEGSEVSDKRNYTHHYCYEEAIEYITGMPVEIYIKLSADELKNLRERKKRGEEAAAYVLYRLVGEPWNKSISGRGKIAVLK